MEALILELKNRIIEALNLLSSLLLLNDIFVFDNFFYF